MLYQLIRYALPKFTFSLCVYFKGIDETEDYTTVETLER